MVTTGSRRSHLLTVHIVAALALLGVDVVLALLGIVGLGDTDPATVYPAAHRIGEWLAVPLAVTALVTGVGLVAGGAASLRTDRWAAAKLVVTVVLAAMLLAAVVPWLHEAGREALGAGEVTDAMRRRLALAPAGASAALLLNAVLGRYKPWRSGRSGAVRTSAPSMPAPTRRGRDGRGAERGARPRAPRPPGA